MVYALSTYKPNQAYRAADNYSVYFYKEHEDVLGE